MFKKIKRAKMSTVKSLIQVWLSSALLTLGATAAFSQVPNSQKLESESIIEAAKAGRSQEVMVEFESAGIEYKSDSQRLDVMRKHDAARREALQRHAPTEGMDVEARRQSDNLLQSLHTQLGAIKLATFSDHLSGECVITQDYPNLPLAAVRVPDYDSLLKLLSNQNVKRVRTIKQYRLDANWPISYSDISIVHSDPRQGVGGYKGAGTRVVVIDSAAFLGAIPGWDESKAACLPYSTGASGSFVQTNLAIGQTGISSNCRVWSMYNTAGTDAPCAAPINQDGTRNGCYGSNWQHATLIDDIIAKVAPSAYITNVQAYDSAGASTSKSISKAFDWVFQHRDEQPRIVAVNLSSSTPGILYSAPCPSSDLAAVIGRLRSVQILTVVSTGNDSSALGIGEPACVPGVIAVGATTDSASVATRYTFATSSCSDPALAADQVPCFSNTDSKMTSMLAPGVNIGSFVPVIANDLSSVLLNSGTSFAAPHVAAAIAVLEGSDAYGFSLNADQVVAKLTASGPSIVNRRAAGYSKHRLDIAAAMGPGVSQPPTMKRLVATPASVQLLVGQTIEIKIEGVNQFGNTMPVTSQGFTWSSPGVAHVPIPGAPTPVMGDRAGSTVLTVVSGALSIQIPVTVTVKKSGGPPDCKSNPTSCS